MRLRIEDGRGGRGWRRHGQDMGSVPAKLWVYTAYATPHSLHRACVHHVDYTTQREPQILHHRACNTKHAQRSLHHMVCTSRFH
eukprot:2604530-Pyramimonas_sp.AAC.1